MSLSILTVYTNIIYIYHISIKTGSWLTHPVDPSPPRKASVPPLPTVAMLFSPAAEGQGGDGDLMGSIMRDHIYI